MELRTRNGFRVWREVLIFGREKGATDDGSDGASCEANFGRIIRTFNDGLLPGPER
jgi:hypothetical protein